MFFCIITLITPLRLGGNVMTTDTMDNLILMTAGDVCTLLSIKESTLRKYALILQDAGYHFHTNSKGQRGYYDRDVTVLRRFLEIKKSPDMTLEQSANAVLSWVEQSDMSLRVMGKDEENERYNDDIKELKDVVNKQNELIKDLVTRMDQQQKYIDEKLTKRDELILEALRESQRESQETKQLLLTAQAVAEEAKRVEEKKPRKGIMKWFSKE